jgi:hypothetical protein
MSTNGRVARPDGSNQVYVGREIFMRRKPAFLFIKPHPANLTGVRAIEIAARQPKVINN